jgi:hypothetical protein
MGAPIGHTLRTKNYLIGKDKCNCLFFSRYCTDVPCDCMKDLIEWMKSKKEVLEKWSDFINQG